MFYAIKIWNVLIIYMIKCSTVYTYRMSWILSAIWCPHTLWVKIRKKCHIISIYYYFVFFFLIFLFSFFIKYLQNTYAYMTSFFLIFTRTMTADYAGISHHKIFHLIIYIIPLIYLVIIFQINQKNIFTTNIVTKLSQAYKIIR